MSPSEGKEASEISQGQAALHSRTFCFLILSLHYGPGLAFLFSVHFLLEERSPSKSLSCHPPKDSSHTHSSSPHGCPSCPPAACRPISTYHACFHLKFQHIYSGLNPFPPPQWHLMTAFPVPPGLQFPEWKPPSPALTIDSIWQERYSRILCTRHWG